MASAQVRWRGQFASAAVRLAATSGLRKAAEFISGESAKEVPIQEGTLSRSRRVTVDGGRMMATISYDTPYAVRQHEDMSLSHPGGRKAKYLEDPLLRNREKVREFLAQTIRGALK